MKLTFTTASEITSQKWPRHITEWALLELQQHKSVQCEDICGRIMWSNVRGYKATGSTKPVQHIEKA